MYYATKISCSRSEAFVILENLSFEVSYKRELDEAETNLFHDVLILVPQKFPYKLTHVFFQLHFENSILSTNQSRPELEQFRLTCCLLLGAALLYKKYENNSLI